MGHPYLPKEADALSQYYCNGCTKTSYSVLFTPSCCMACGCSSIKKIKHKNFDTDKLENVPANY